MGLLPGHFESDVLPVIQRHPDSSQAGDLSTRLRASFKIGETYHKILQEMGKLRGVLGLGELRSISRSAIQP